MRIAFYDTHRFERPGFERANAKLGHDIRFLEARLTAETAALAEGTRAVCAFVNDRLDASALEVLARLGVRLIALRSAGFNHVDLEAASRLGLRVARVPAYSPNAVAEYAACLMLALDRKVHRAFARVRELNFSLDGLVGFDLHGKTVGVIGTGRIGSVLARILGAGFGCRVLAHDLVVSPALADVHGLRYVDLDTLYCESDVISLHVPLNPGTRHLLDAGAFGRMKPGVMIINTGRGGLIDAKALIDALKTGRVGAAGLDVYEEEEKVFFRDLSEQVLQDDTLARLLTFPNVLITSHQAFLTREALDQIAATTLKSVTDFERGAALDHEVCVESHVARP